ncbi:MAG: iron uptake porin [Symploca sp. SIO2E9]|nr:iron uptake porin [Symploca sp. SIO2E9]
MMSKIFWNTLKVSPALLGASLLVASSAYASGGVPEQTATTTTSEATASRETGVKYLTDLPQATVEGTSASVELSPSFELAQQTPTEATTADSAEMLEQIDLYNQEVLGTESLDQVTNVSQLRDVSPGDWAYEALRSLVERYGCIAGYPDGTYRGNRPTTRYEFAAGLNACLDQIVRLIEGGAGIDPEELATLERLIAEFEAELATLGTRVDNLEGRVAFLEDHQFSTTTKLKGEAIFAVSSVFGSDELALNTGERFIDEDGDGDDDGIDDDGDGIIDRNRDDIDVDDEVTFSNRVRLNFDASFTGKDRLRVRLQAGNFTSLTSATGTDMARLGFDAGGGNNVTVNDLHYRFPFGDNIRVWLGANGFDFNDMANTHNPLLQSSGTGFVSRFNRRNPAIFRNSADQGAGVNVKFGEGLSLDLGYFTDDGESPADKDGIFNGELTALAQLNFQPFDALDLGFAFGYSYYPGGEVDLSGSTGSGFAKDPFDGDAASAFRFGIQGDFKVTDNISIGGWGGLLLAESESGATEGDEADIWNFAGRIAFSDLGKEGAVLGIGGGMLPKVTDNDLGRREDDDTSFIVEAVYKYPLNDNILITPGAYVIFDPNHNADNEEIWVGVIRTTFKF